MEQGGASALGFADPGRLADIERAARRALARDPSDAPSLNNLGVAMALAGEPVRALDIFARAVVVDPGRESTHLRLGKLLWQIDRTTSARAALGRALISNPGDARANEAFILALPGHAREADQTGRLDTWAWRAVCVDPMADGPHLALGVHRHLTGQPVSATMAFHRALLLNPAKQDGWLALGRTMMRMNRAVRAKSAFRRGSTIDPYRTEALAGQAEALCVLGRPEAGFRFLKMALCLEPGSYERHSQLVFIVSYVPHLTREQVHAVYRTFTARFGGRHGSSRRSWDNRPDPDRRLRIGYVGPVFHDHSSASFLEPLLEHHDRSVVETTAYAQVRRDDDVSARYRRLVDRWVIINDLDDDALEERIRADGIDILIDLAGHTVGSRTLVFTRKPAPISARWLDDGHTSGLAAIDYFIGDRHFVPPEEAPYFAERIWRLPRATFPFKPHQRLSRTGPRPPLAGRAIRFGTISRSIRQTTRMYAIYAEILRNVPNSVLLIYCKAMADPETAAQIVDRIVGLGVPRDRLEIGFTREISQTLNKIDIALDCIPRTSGLTLYEHLWFGTPFITLAGPAAYGTLGSSLAHGIGHPELIAASERDYVRLAVDLAHDPDRLTHLHQTIRSDLERSPIMDPVGFARDMEAAYREMWRAWCREHRPVTTARAISGATASPPPD